MQRLDRKDVAEKAVTAVFFAAVFLPVRLVFYTYVSEYWLGSFGVMTGMLLFLFYAAKRNWLGRLGFVVTRQVDRISSGKIGKWGIVSCIILIYIYGNFIYGIESAPLPIAVQMIETLESQGVTSMETLAVEAQGREYSWLNILAALAVMLIPNETGWAAFSVINDLSQGWAMHFATVILVQELELLGILVYFRYIRNRIKKP